MADLKEHPILSQIPYPELYNPKPVTNQLRLDLLAHSGALEFGEAGKPKQTGTLLDLPGLSDEMTNEQLLDVVCVQLKLSRKDLDEETPEAKERVREAYAKMNTALSEAERYIREVLNLRSASAQVNSKEDLIELLRKTTLYKETKKKNLEPHATYCALLSVALAVFELQKEESHLLEGELAYLEDAVTKPSDFNEHQPLFPKGFAGGTDEGVVIQIPGIHTSPPIRLSMRDKSRNSQITKFLMKPEANAAEALKDALGMRLEIPDQRIGDKRAIEEVIVKILAYFSWRLDAVDLKVEDTNFIQKERLDDLRKRMHKGEVKDGHRIHMNLDTNPLSGEDFQTLKISGKVRVPRGGVEAKTKAFIDRRPFEIILVRPGKTDEHGLLSHVIYDLKKQITVMTRLFGGCSEKWLIEQIRKISTKKEFIDNVIQGLQDPSEGFLMRMPRTKKVYAASGVYKRWLRIPGLITDEKIRDSVEHKLGI